MTIKCSGSWGRNWYRKVRETGSSRERLDGATLFVKTGWGHPLCGTNVSLWRIHLHRHWTGVRFGFVEVPEVSSAIKAPVGLPILCHKSLLSSDKHPSSRPCSGMVQTQVTAQGWLRASAH